MATPNYKSLLEGFEREPEVAKIHLAEMFKEKALAPSDFDYGRLWAECFGWNEFLACRSRTRTAHDVMEAAGAVTSDAFQSISYQIVYNATLESYKAPEFVVTKLIPEVNTQFRTEKIAGITGIGERFPVVGENEAFPTFGVAQNWIETSLTQKRGGIVPVTWEAVFYDRTGQLLDQCKDVGYWGGYDRELRAIDCVIDANAGATTALSGGHRYRWKGNDIATYGDNSGTHNWDNLQASNALLDYTTIEKAELLFDAMTDPGTGIVTGVYRAAAKHLVVPTKLVHTAKQIFLATEIRLHAGGYATSGNLYDRVSANTLQNYEIVTSPLIGFRLDVSTNWFLGNVSRAFRYMQNLPPEVREAPSNNNDEFHRDIVQQFRFREVGAYSTWDPRFLVKSTA